MGCKSSKVSCFKSRKKKRAKSKEQEQFFQELSILKSDNAQQVSAYEELEREKAELLEKHKWEIQGLLQEHAEEKKTLKNTHKAETEMLIQELKIQAEKERHAEITKCLAEQLNSLKKEHEEKCKALQRLHEKEKTSLTESFEKSQASLQESVEELSAQLKTFHEKMKRAEESILNRNYRRQIQEYGSPSHFWRQELESLHFVIDMKNERLHNQDKKLLHLEWVMEQNLALDEKIKLLQQENENLHVRTQNHMSVARQLSEQLLATQEALEKETHLRQQLHHEKEELLYRVLNGDAAATFTLSTVTPDVSLMVT
ncbi:coiled-coil domain-containing protein 69 [Microcaecilia unicolor]|uniref:Coiled-coil domain-containing protein 69 n=1 Tax=Microcaecilia unicolor TaxID=1415580 RepID=A0A6P7YZ32_9AMPH|nr:coiled-coil domain-containing protein 69 [Microcaecilia unicolor]